MSRRVLRLHAQGLSMRAIARETGLPYSRVYRTLDPERFAASDRRGNAKRNAAKRAWDRESYRGLCACGAETSRREDARCRRCHDRDVRAERLAKARRIESMWAAGESLRTIAWMLGTTVNTVCQEMSRLRREGLADLPYRRTTSPRRTEAA